jgi:NAD(P)-dependent dehydrogenase (short-subunit alcohol dehydrogenase family)
MNRGCRRQEDLLLSGKNIFFTGGSRGIGHDAVIELARYGANIAFTYVQDRVAAERTVEEIKDINSVARVTVYQLDVRNSRQVASVSAASIGDMGTIDVVVNNAGILRDALVAQMSDKQWLDVIDTNLTGTFFVCRAFLSEFLRNKGGKFINTSSITHTGSAGQANYSAAKAGIVGFSKALAKEWGNKKIYTNIVLPGYFESEMTHSNATARIVESFVSMSSLKRGGQGHEYGKAVVFFASALSTNINGHALEVSGGLSVVPPL